MKTLLTVVCAILFMTTSIAQGRGNAMGHGKGLEKNKGAGNPNISAEDLAKKHTEKLSSKINLTPEQFTKVYQLKLTRIQAFRAAKSANNNQMRKDANQQYREGMKQVLTPEQLQLLKSMKKEHIEKKKEKKEKGGKPAPKSPKSDEEGNEEDEPDFD